MDERAQYIIIGHRRKTWVHSAVAILSLLIAVISCYLFFTGFHMIEVTSATKHEGGFIEIALVCFALGIYLLISAEYLIDVEGMRYKKEHKFLGMRFGPWRKLKSIDYVAVFKKKEEDFRVKLWYNTNKHFSICSYYDATGAIEEADLLASRLDVDVWDATNPRHGKWR